MLRPPGAAEMASLIRRAVGSMGASLKKRRALCLAVVPHGQGGVEMGDFDLGAAIEGGVEGAEAEDLGFGAAGGGAVGVLAALAQGGIAIHP